MVENKGKDELGIDQPLPVIKPKEPFKARLSAASDDPYDIHLPLPAEKPENFRPLKIAFVYAGGREEREDGPSDFFYGARELEKWGDKIEIIDLDQAAPAGFNARAYDFALKHLTPARTRGTDFEHTQAILKRLNSCDCVVATFAGAALALAFWKKMRRLRVPLVAIQCGLVNYHLQTLRKFSTRLLLKNYPSILFAGSERSAMKSRFGLSNREVVNGVYGIDMDFWCPGGSSKNEGVLSVGNDARRDYSMLLSAARELDTEVRVLTKRSLPPMLPENMKLLNADWHENAIDDEELRKMYREAACVAIPLKSSLQPSGQSVALQAIACGTPVVMTNTIGNWSRGILEEGEGIFFSRTRDHLSLSTTIKKVLESKEARKSAIAAREKLIKNGVSIQGFARRVREQISIVTGQGSDD